MFNWLKTLFGEYEVDPDIYPFEEVDLDAIEQVDMKKYLDEHPDDE